MECPDKRSIKQDCSLLKSTKGIMVCDALKDLDCKECHFYRKQGETPDEYRRRKRLEFKERQEASSDE